VSVSRHLLVYRFERREYQQRLPSLLRNQTINFIKQKLQKIWKIYYNERKIPMLSNHSLMDPMMISR
jgi:hypothetical protein